MPNFRPVDRNLKFIAVDFEARILPGTFEHVVSVLVDQELDLTPFIETYRNDDTGAPAYHPSILLNVILCGYSLFLNKGDEGEAGEMTGDMDTATALRTPAVAKIAHCQHPSRRERGRRVIDTVPPHRRPFLQPR